MNYLRHGVCVEVDDSIEVQFSAQDIEKDVLTVALVEFAHFVHQFRVHGKGLTRVGRTVNHGPHLVLKLLHLVVEVSVLFLQVIAFLLDGLELLRQNFVRFTKVFNLFGAHHLYNVSQYELESIA